MINVTESIRKASKSYLNLAEDAGCGMYNFRLDVPEYIGKSGYDTEVLLQVYPDSPTAPIFIVLYYKLPNGNYDNESLMLSNMSESSQMLILEAFRKQIINNPNNTHMHKLAKYIKWDDSNREGTLVRLFNLWEDDRCANGVEYLYNLADLDEFKSFAEAYGLDKAIECYQSCQYWIGGSNFTANEAEVDGCTFLIHSVNLSDSETFDKELNNILGNIEDRISYYRENENTSWSDISSFYDDIIDLKSCYIDSLYQRYAFSSKQTERCEIFNEMTKIARGENI